MNADQTISPDNGENSEPHNLELKKEINDTSFFQNNFTEKTFENNKSHEALF